MKNAIIPLAFTALFGLKLSAQEAVPVPETKPRYGGGGGFNIGYGYMDVSDLQVFTPAGTPQFREDHLLMGGEGHAFLGNFVIGGGGMGLIGDQVKTDSLSISLGGGMGTFDIGYLIINGNKLKFFPMLGIGGNGYGLSIARNEDVSVSEVAARPAREINISTGGVVLDISLNLNAVPMLEYDPEDDSYGGFMTGLKIGYLLGFPSSDWGFAGGDVIGGPRFGLNMVYAKLVLGGFGFDARAAR